VRLRLRALGNPGRAYKKLSKILRADYLLKWVLEGAYPGVETPVIPDEPDALDANMVFTRPLRICRFFHPLGKGNMILPSFCAALPPVATLVRLQKKLDEMQEELTAPSAPFGGLGQNVRAGRRSG